MAHFEHRDIEIWLEFERNGFNELIIFSEGSFKPKKTLDDFECG